MAKKKQSLEGISFKLPLTIKTGKYVVGYRQALRLLRKNKVKYLVVAANFPSILTKKLEYYSALLNDLPLTIYSGNNNDLAKLCQFNYRASVVSILDEGEADLLGMQG